MTIPSDLKTVHDIRLCETCGGFWHPDEYPACCGHPVLDPRRVHRAIYEGERIVSQSEVEYAHPMPTEEQAETLRGGS